MEHNNETIKNKNQVIKKIISSSLKVLLLLLILVWPVFRWLMALAVFFQALKVFYHWNQPGLSELYIFLSLFFALSFLTFLVTRRRN